MSLCFSFSRICPEISQELLLVYLFIYLLSFIGGDYSLEGHKAPYFQYENGDFTSNIKSHDTRAGSSLHD